MSVVLSSNTAYRDQFSGRARSFLPGERVGKQKKKERKRENDIPIPALSARRTQPQIRPFAENMSSLKNVLPFPPMTDFSRLSRDGDITDNAPPLRRTSLFTRQLSQASCPSRNYPSRGSLRLLGDPRLVGQVDRTRDLLHLAAATTTTMYDAVASSSGIDVVVVSRVGF